MLEAIQAFYKDSKAIVRIEGEESASFEINVEVRQGCLMSPWLFIVYMDIVVKELRVWTMVEGASLTLNGRK